ncbi:MAG: hypothetical protein Q8R01_02870 [Ramlibacter sp.]|nr:hypothetical protein [Ramlibacter sp.]
MIRLVIAALVPTIAMAVAWAQGPDPLKSVECKVALDALEGVVAEKTQGPVRAQRVGTARRHAADACLGRSDDNRVRSGAPQPAQAVRPPVTTATPSAPSLPSASPPPPPPLAIPRPTVITTCDPAGCWDSEGRRLNNMGPLLMGPRGPCTVQGGVATCP